MIVAPTREYSFTTPDAGQIAKAKYFIQQRLRQPWLFWRKCPNIIYHFYARLGLPGIVTSI